MLPAMAQDQTLATRVRELARLRPDAPAFWSASGSFSWSEYDALADRLARCLLGLGFVRGERIAVLLPDGPAVHTAFLAVERAGLVIVGVGARAGQNELEHLLRLSESVALISGSEHQGEAVAGIVQGLRARGIGLRHHLEFQDCDAGRGALMIDGAPAQAWDSLRVEPEPESARTLDETFLLNSTSGTTGMPKCVIHDQRRWLAFHRFAVESGELSGDDVFMSVLPASVGFGIWTAHVTPTLLGVPTVLMDRFDADATLACIESHRVSVLAAVSTQFIMLLSSPEFEQRDLSSLRVLYTGGEAVPRARAEAFEDRTGAKVLQFYGSNEVGAVSRTQLSDSRDKRFGTAGKVLPEMNVRLFDSEGQDVTQSGRGQPGCKGPTLSGGYCGDPEANAALVREDGWMMLGDIVTIDPEGYLRVIGRTDDFIIRGGKNISALAVEEQVGTHPAVLQVAVVAMPDETFGEKVCAFVELRPGETLELPDLLEHLRECGASREYFPEHLVVLDALPRASGGKIAKGKLRERVSRARSSS